MTVRPTHYDTLEVTREASGEVIRGAYRYLAQKWHPDKNPQRRAEAEARLSDINQAYDVLSDPARRCVYDLELAQDGAEADAESRAHGDGGVDGNDGVRIDKHQREEMVDTLAAKHGWIVWVPVVLLCLLLSVSRGVTGWKLAWLFLPYLIVGAVWSGLRKPRFVRMPNLQLIAQYEAHRGMHRGVKLAVFAMVAVALVVGYLNREGQPVARTGGTQSAAVQGAMDQYRERRYTESMPVLLTAAGQGDVEAQAVACEALAMGRGVAKDIGRAVGWCERAAAAGSPLGQGMLGLLQLTGLAPGVAKDVAAGTALVESAAARSDPRAVRLLGDLSFNGIGRAQSDSQALALYQRAADLGDANAMARLGLMALQGRAMQQNDATALALIQQSAQLGDAYGQYLLGWMHLFGQGAAQDNAAALGWARAAADQENPDGQWLLGELYKRGAGVAQDPVRAAAWYRTSAEQGNAWGQRDIGAAYDYGQGVAADRVQAAQWYALAAAQGDGSAQFRLAEMYELGEGVARNEAEAFRWYSAAASGGSPAAKHRVADFHLEGRGGAAQDHARALALYQEVAGLNLGALSDHAALLAAGMLYNGLGTPRNLDAARGWLAQAVVSSDARVADAARQALAEVNAPPAAQATAPAGPSSTSSTSGRVSPEAILFGSIVALGLIYAGNPSNDGLDECPQWCGDCRAYCQQNALPMEQSGCRNTCFER